MAEQTTQVGERELVIERIFDAPRELVWRVWTEPEHVMRWWGPAGFTAPSCTIDLRVGGRYLYCMRSPDGQDYWSTGVFQELVPFERIVATDSFADAEGNVVPASYYDMPEDLSLEFTITVTFEDLGDQTRMTLRHVGMSDAHAGDASGGWNESFDKLAALLAEIA